MTLKTRQCNNNKWAFDAIANEMRLSENKSMSYVENIKAVYKKLALQHHPDKNLNDPTADGKFQQLCSAYEIMLKREKRDETVAERTSKKMEAFESRMSEAVNIQREAAENFWKSQYSNEGGGEYSDIYNAAQGLASKRAAAARSGVKPSSIQLSASLGSQFNNSGIFNANKSVNGVCRNSTTAHPSDDRMAHIPSVSLNMMSPQSPVDPRKNQPSPMKRMSPMKRASPMKTTSPMKRSSPLKSSPANNQSPIKSRNGPIFGDAHRNKFRESTIKRNGRDSVFEEVIQSRGFAQSTMKVGSSDKTPDGVPLGRSTVTTDGGKFHFDLPTSPVGNNSGIQRSYNNILGSTPRKSPARETENSTPTRRVIPIPIPVVTKTYAPRMSRDNSPSLRGPNFKPRDRSMAHGAGKSQQKSTSRNPVNRVPPRPVSETSKPGFFQGTTREERKREIVEYRKAMLEERLLRQHMKSEDPPTQRCTTPLSGPKDRYAPPDCQAELVRMYTEHKDRRDQENQTTKETEDSGANKKHHTKDKPTDDTKPPLVVSSKAFEPHFPKGTINIPLQKPSLNSTVPRSVTTIPNKKDVLERMYSLSPKGRERKDNTHHDANAQTYPYPRNQTERRDSVNHKQTPILSDINYNKGNSLSGEKCVGDITDVESIDQGVSDEKSDDMIADEHKIIELIQEESHNRVDVHLLVMRRLRDIRAKAKNIIVDGYYAEMSERDDIEEMWFIGFIDLMQLW